MLTEPPSTPTTDTVRVPSRSIPPRWESIRVRSALRTCAPWGARVVSLTQSRKIPLKNITTLDHGQIANATIMNGTIMNSMAEEGGVRRTSHLSPPRRMSTAHDENGYAVLDNSVRNHCRSAREACACDGRVRPRSCYAPGYRASAAQRARTQGKSRSSCVGWHVRWHAQRRRMCVFVRVFVVVRGASGCVCACVCTFVCTCGCTCLCARCMWI